MKIFFKTLIILCIISFFFLLIVINVKAQEIEIIEVNNIKEKLPLVIDSKEVEVKKFDEKTKTFIKEDTLIQYSYISDEKVDKNIIFCDLCDYSSTEIIDKKHVKIYSGTPFYRNSNGETVEIKTEYAKPYIWEEANEQVLSFENYIKNLLSVPYAIAESYYSSGDDGLFCSNGVTDCYNTFSACQTALQGKSRGNNELYINSSFGGGLYCIDRVFLNFTSSLTGNVASSSLYVYGFGKTAGTRSYNVYGSTASNPVVTTDFDLTDTTEMSTAISQSDFNASGYNMFLLNSSGIANIDVDGTSKFSLREVTSDVANSQPTDAVNVQIYGSAHTGTDKDPFLIIEIEEEEPTATTSVDFFPCEIPENNDIGIITGCKNIYNGTTSSSTITGVEYFYYDVKFILYLFILSIIFVCLSIINIFLKENEKKKK
jgi:hypothetical protein